jgi:hypothetical protein
MRRHPAELEGRSKGRKFQTVLDIGRRIGAAVEGGQMVAHRDPCGLLDHFGQIRDQERRQQARIEAARAR